MTLQTLQAINSNHRPSHPTSDLDDHWPDVPGQLAPPGGPHQGLLGGPWVAISRVISTLVTIPITLLIITHEPPSRVED